MLIFPDESDIIDIEWDIIDIGNHSNFKSGETIWLSGALWKKSVCVFLNAQSTGCRWDMYLFLSLSIYIYIYGVFNLWNNNSMVLDWMEPFDWRDILVEGFKYPLAI